MREGKASKDEYKYFLEHSNDVDETSIQEALDKGYAASYADFQEALTQASISAQNDPAYKEHLEEIQKEAEKGKLSSKLASGIGLVLAGTDIANSIAQIDASKNATRRSIKPRRPTIPGRDQYLAQQLRESQEASNDAGRALAPAVSQIQDQYNADLSAAKTASTGQAGAFGSMAQIAADRRNRSAAGLVPMADDIRRQQDQRTDALVGARMGETQQQFDNAASLYPIELQQYNAEQAAAGALGSQGRSNLRNSLYGAAQLGIPTAADLATERKYRRLREQAAGMYGDEVAEQMVQAEQNIQNDWQRPRRRPGAIATTEITDPITRETRYQRYNPQL